MFQFNVADVPEPIALPAGEYIARIVKFEDRARSKGPGTMSAITLTFPNNPDSKLLTHYLMHPDTVEDETKMNNCLRRIKQFCNCFGLDADGGFDESDAVGSEGTVILDMETSEEWGEQNNIRRFIAQ